MAVDNTIYFSFPAIKGYGKQSIFFASQSGLWETEHILDPQPHSAMGNNSYSSSPAMQGYENRHILVPPPYRSMEHRRYSSSPAIQGYGEQSIF
jgi:hypothetical protein